MSPPLALITGSCGLIGSEVCVYFHRFGFRITGIDNNQRAVFFGPEGDTRWVPKRLVSDIDTYSHHHVDILDQEAIRRLIRELKPAVIIHTVAQPSHDRPPYFHFDHCE